MLKLFPLLFIQNYIIAQNLSFVTFLHAAVEAPENTNLKTLLYAFAMETMATFQTGIYDLKGSRQV